jgi:hypothetical protein
MVNKNSKKHAKLSKNSDKILTKKRNTRGGNSLFETIKNKIKSGIDVMKTETQKYKIETQKYKIESQKKFNYLASSNPITIYLKYHNNNCFAGTVVKHLPRCKSLIIDYDFGMLIFSIINYICEGKQGGIDFNSILKKYVDEYMGKLNISNAEEIDQVDSSHDSSHLGDSSHGDSADSDHSNSTDKSTDSGDSSEIESKVVTKHKGIYEQLKTVVEKKHSKYNDDYLNYYLIYQYKKNDKVKFSEIKNNIKKYESEFPKDSSVV